MAISANFRIISLVPSLTEFVIDMGLKKHLIGRTRFCISPEDKIREIEIIGGTKNPRIEKIVDLQPDIIIANKEENRKEDIEALYQTDAEIFLTDIVTIEDALLTMHELGGRLNVEKQTSLLVEQILNTLEDRPDEQPLQTAYFIWQNPLMTVGKNTYIHDVLQHWNLTNVFSYLSRYPEVTTGHLQLLEPELILLSSEPFPFQTKHISFFKEAYSKTSVELVDGTWFSWYGSRMLQAFEHLNTWRKEIAATVF